MSMKEVKVLKKDQKEVEIITDAETGAGVVARITKGYSFVVTKDKDGQPLAEPQTHAKELSTYFVDDDGNTYYQFSRKDEIVSKKCELIDVLVLVSTNKDKKVYTKVVPLPTYLVGASEATLRNYLAFRLI